MAASTQQPTQAANSTSTSSAGSQAPREALGGNASGNQAQRARSNGNGNENGSTRMSERSVASEYIRQRLWSLMESENDQDASNASIVSASQPSVSTRGADRAHSSAGSASAGTPRTGGGGTGGLSQTAPSDREVHTSASASNPSDASRSSIASSPATLLPGWHLDTPGTGTGHFPTSQ